MTIFILIFLIIFYLNFRFISAYDLFKLSSEEQKISNTSGLYVWLLILPFLLLIVLGFLLMKWYYFLPIAILILADPCVTIFPKLYFRFIKRWSIKMLDNYFFTVLGFINLSTIALWVNYYYNFY